MNARKKLIPINIEAESQRITDQVNGLSLGTLADRAALMKDVHLLAAAVNGDRVIVSGDHALKALCDLYLEEHIEWLLVSPDDEAVHRDALLNRLLQMSTARSNLK